MSHPQDKATPVAYGAWPSPVTEALVAAHRISRSTLRPFGSTLYWTESRPKEAGRAVVLAADAGQEPQEVLPEDRSARSGVHEYGGGAFCVVPPRHGAAPEAAVAFVDQGDQGIYLVDPSGGRGQATLVSKGAPEGERWAHGDLWPTPEGRWILAVRERHHTKGQAPVRRQLVAVPASPDVGQEAVLWEGADFVAAARPGPTIPGGRWLAWVSWNHPDMSWDASSLWVGRLTEGPQGLGLEVHRQVAGGEDHSVGQPTWCEGAGLVFVSDAGGYWQPWRWQDAQGSTRLSDLEAEFHAPDWQLGQSTLWPWDPTTVACKWRLGGRDHVGLLDVVSGQLEELDQPCVGVSALCALPGGLAWLGTTPWSPTSTWWCPLERASAGGGGIPTGPGGPRPGPFGAGSAGSHEPLGRAVVSVGQPLSVTGPTTPTGPPVRVPAVYYPPAPVPVSTPEGSRPPLIVQCHGGPTGSAEPGLDLVVQYFTSRGFAVVQVDYRGSAGHGRRFRQALEGQWGRADVADCTAVARSLAGRRVVDEGSMAIRGSSAGGFTALGSLVEGEVFVAATSWYGVTDLESLAAVTHDFEAHYLDRLVGPLPQAKEEYRRRSPRHRAGDLNGAVLVLQGLNDPVVPPEQSQSLVDALRARGRRCEYLTFAGEGHGFRQAQTLEVALASELAFYRDVMGITTPTASIGVPGWAGG